MSSLAEIEAAAARLSPHEQRQLRAFLTRQLESKKAKKAVTADPLARIREHRLRMLELTGGKPMLTKKGWELLAKAIRGE